MTRARLLEDSQRFLWYAKEARSSMITQLYGEQAAASLARAGEPDLARDVRDASELCNPALYDKAWDRVRELRDAEPVETPIDPRDPDYSRQGVFQTHNCYRCKDGERACVRGGNPRQCEFLHARND
jgi:hypothetical protein